MLTSRMHSVCRGSIGLMFGAACLLLVGAMTLGGSARGDVASLVILRPLAIACLGIGLFHLPRGVIRQHWPLLAFASACLGLVALYLVPLPPAVWRALPGRDLISAIDIAAGLGKPWRPASLAPAATWNALWAMLVPVALLVLVIQLDARQLRKLLHVAIGCGLVSAGLGLLQILGDPHGPLYFYRETNNGSAVGLFANRNHQALLLALMLPMLVVAWQDGRGLTANLALMAGVLFLPLTLVTGSRAGLLAALVGLLALPLLLKRDKIPKPHPRSGPGSRTRVAGLLGLVVVLGTLALALWLGRDLAWSRLTATESGDELRFDLLPVLVAMITDTFPAGSGAGSFATFYQVYEPDALLLPVWVNHAHNDWLEVIATTGLAGGLLIAIACMAVTRLSWRAFLPPTDAPARAVRFARLGCLLLILVGLASASDYPLRTPALACLAVVALLWARTPLIPENRPASS